MTLWENKQFLAERIHKYPFLAQVPTGKPRPEHVDVEVYGHHISGTLERGTRTFGFQTEAQRDLFCKDYSATKLESL